MCKKCIENFKKDLTNYKDAPMLVEVIEELATMMEFDLGNKNQLKPSITELVESQQERVGYIVDFFCSGLVGVELDKDEFRTFVNEILAKRLAKCKLSKEYEEDTATATRLIDEFFGNSINFLKTEENKAFFQVLTEKLSDVLDKDEVDEADVSKSFNKLDLALMTHFIEALRTLPMEEAKVFIEKVKKWCVSTSNNTVVVHEKVKGKSILDLIENSVIFFTLLGKYVIENQLDQDDYAEQAVMYRNKLATRLNNIVACLNEEDILEIKAGNLFAEVGNV